MHYTRAVKDMTGLDDDFIWNKYPYALGLQAHSMWWQDYNDRRFLSAIAAFVRLPEIVVSPVYESGENARDLIV